MLFLHLSACFSVTKFTVCNETGQLSELQANICAVKKDVDALWNITNLLLNHYMLPHDIQSMTTVYTVSTNSCWSANLIWHLMVFVVTPWKETTWLVPYSAGSREQCVTTDQLGEWTSVWSLGLLLSLCKATNLAM